MDRVEWEWEWAWEVEGEEGEGGRVERKFVGDGMGREGMG